MITNFNSVPLVSMVKGFRNVNLKHQVHEFQISGPHQYGFGPDVTLDGFGSMDKVVRGAPLGTAVELSPNA
jgi:hypothetical protein